MYNTKVGSNKFTEWNNNRVRFEWKVVLPQLDPNVVLKYSNEDIWTCKGTFTRDDLSWGLRDFKLPDNW